MQERIDFLKNIRSEMFPRPHRSVLRVLQWELPLIMLWAVAMLIILLRDYPEDPLGAAHHFMDCAEYIGVSLVLSIATAVFFDLILRESQRDEHSK